MDYKHIPVMLKEVLEYLDPQSGQYFIDCTLGGAGYTIAIAKRVLPDGKVLAIDLDEMAIENAKLLISPQLNKFSAGQANYKLHNIILENDNFSNISKIVKKHFKGKPVKFNGIVLDLGLSSAQLADRSRGFSFQLDAPINMDFRGLKMVEEDEEERSTEYILNNWKQEELEKIIREYGEEKFSKRIAQKIVEQRKLKLIETTGQLVEIINQAVPDFYKSKKINCATKTFQALRIASNNELENLQTVLPQALDLLAKGGRIVVISYHSLEDRIVKNFFRQESRDCLCPPDYPICQCKHERQLKRLTRKIIRAGKEEVLNNPRSRSAKLRAAEKI